ncbi:MAG: hypothetical protein N2260_04270 [Syntrophobacterales bacterium]|nr:hypothetical protein [Syntrophobacterales bacterium]
MSNARLLKKIELPNGLILYCYDKSKHIAGDRWYVCLRIEVPIEVRKEFFNGEQNPEEAYKEFVEAFGHAYFFSYEKERNFIADKDVQPLLEELLKDFMDNSSAYLTRSTWQKMCILKAYRDWKERIRLRQLHEEVIKRADEGN